MEIPPNIVPSKAFFPIHMTIGGANEPPLTAVGKAAVDSSGFVFGRDINSGRVFQFYKSPRVKKNVDTPSVAFDLDFDTDELEWLIALIEHVKGPGTCKFKRGKQWKQKRLTVEPEPDWQ